MYLAGLFDLQLTIVVSRLDPAIVGTTGLLKAVKQNAPTVKRVVITSSFAAIVDAARGAGVGHTYVPVQFAWTDRVKVETLRITRLTVEQLF